MKATIRRAVAADAPALLELVREYWAFEGIDGFDPVPVARALGLLLADPARGAGWIALAGDVPAGYLLAVYVLSLEHGGLTAEIDELFVRDAHRSGGVGRALLETAESEFVRAGCTNVALQLGRANDAARRFYHRCGYRERSGYELLDRML